MNIRWAAVRLLGGEALRCRRLATAVGLLVLASSLAGQALVLLPYGASWKYNDQGIDKREGEVTLEVGQPLTLQVTASGTSPACQWQRRNDAGTFAAIEGATGSVYSVAQAQTNHSGDYRAVITNLAGSVASRVARVEVLPDTTGAALLTAVADGTLVEVTFSENVEFSSGSQSANYVIREWASGTNVPATVNGFPNGPVVRLRVPMLDPGANYVLTVNRVKDRLGNVIAPDSQVPVLFATNAALVPMDQVWRWSEDNLPLPPEWRTNHLEPYLYGEGPGVFHNVERVFDICRGAKNTHVSIGPRTHYFTTRFELPAVVPISQFTLTHLVDDGAVFHLNGKEVARFNMPVGPVSHDTIPLTSINDATCVTNIINGTNLLAGTNVLAVEVHQYQITDVMFGLELQATIIPLRSLPPSPEPALSIRWQTDQVTLAWAGGGWALEWAAAITGPWREAQPGMANPYATTIPEAASRFWRLRQKQF